MLIESHAHYSHQKFGNKYPYLSYDRASDEYTVEMANRPTLFQALRQQGIAIVEPAIEIASNQRLLDLAAANPGWIFPAVGLHPTRTPNEKWSDRRILNELSKRPEVVAIGEAGMDYHYPRKDQHRLCQLRWYVFQILLAHRRRLPLILHIRMADRAALPILQLLKPLLHGGVVHCFSGDMKTAQAYMKLGFHLGIGGTLLQYGKAGETVRETVKRVPLNRILLETDAPYIHPTCDAVPSGKKRSKIRNTSMILPAVARRIAEIKGIDVGEVERQTTENAVSLFRLPIKRTEMA